MPVKLSTVIGMQTVCPTCTFASLEFIVTLNEGSQPDMSIVKDLLQAFSSFTVMV